MSTILLFLTNIFIYLTNILVKKKKKCYNDFSWKKERFSYGSHMDSIYPFSGYHLCKLRKEDKKVEQTHWRLEKQVKGNQDMSRLLEELKGQTVKVTVNGFGTEYEIMDIDEDWVKLSRDTINQQRETKLVRIEDIQDIQL